MAVARRDDGYVACIYGRGTLYHCLASSPRIALMLQCSIIIRCATAICVHKPDISPDERWRILMKTMPAAQLDPHWRDALLPRAGLLAIWPMTTAVQSADTNKSTAAEPEQPEAAAMGVGSSPNAPAPRAGLPAPSPSGISGGIGPIQESCTLYHAIALLACRDDAVAQTLQCQAGCSLQWPNEAASGPSLPEEVQPAQHGGLHRITDNHLLQSLVLQWGIAREFWLTHDLDSPEVAYLRFRRSDLMRLMAEVPDRVP